jgi:hypothetical protein
MAVTGRFLSRRMISVLLYGASFFVLAAYPALVLAPAPSLPRPEKSARLVRHDRPAVTIPARLITSESRSAEIDGFRREWHVSGPALCEAMAQAGLSVTKWRAASLRSLSYECNFLRISQRDGFRPLKSVFLRVSGNARGEISGIRGMVLVPTMTPDSEVRADITRLFETIMAQTGWVDMRSVLPSMIDLKDVDFDQFGARFHFAKVQSDEEAGHRFAFSLDAGPRPQMQVASPSLIR